MDPEKVQAVEEWPTPTDRKSLQRFLGFANFYRRFNRNYSSIAAPLTSTRVKFHWGQEAEEAFRELKKRFTSAPILVHPDSEAQFIVEVDASNVGVGAILSQRLAGDSKVHPCAFYPHRLSPVKQNYDIGNKELLAVKLALGNGDSGWRGLRSHFKFIKTWSICRLQRDSTPIKSDGRYSSPGLIST